MVNGPLHRPTIVQSIFDDCKRLEASEDVGLYCGCWLTSDKASTTSWYTQSLHVIPDQSAKIGYVARERVYRKSILEKKWPGRLTVHVAHGSGSLFSS